VIPIINLNGVGVPLTDLPNVNPQSPPNPLNPNLPAGVGVYDTWSNRADSQYNYTAWSNPGDPHCVPYGPFPGQGVLTGLQISIRVWDEKTQQARQVTLMVDM
jgi:hypothetical protein